MVKGPMAKRNISMQCRSWAKCLVFFLGGGGGNLAERNLGGPWENPRKIFEVFIPEIAADASNFKN